MSAPQPIAFLDLDGVCYDFVGAVEARGIEVDRTSVGLGLPPEHLAKITRDATLYEGPPLPGVTESCERLHGLGFRLVFITSRPNVLDVMKATLDFVDGCLRRVRYAIGLGYALRGGEVIAPETQTPEVIFSHPLGGKPAIVHRLGTPNSIQIDDDPSQLALLGATAPFLIRQPWNANAPRPIIGEWFALDSMMSVVEVLVPALEELCRRDGVSS